MPPEADSQAAPAQPVHPAPSPSAVTPLRALAEARGIKIGSAVSIEGLEDENYRAVLGREFNAVTAENAMKWSAVEPQRGVYDRGPAELLVAFAREHDQQLYGHTLVWHKQVPTWVRDGSFSDAETEALLRKRVTDEVEYFRGRVWAWDVINEALHEDGTLRDSIWLQRIGPDYIANAFRWARAADPDAKLFINDYGIEAINSKSDALYEMVAKLRAEGVPIDGVGFQVHWTLEPLPSSFAANLDRFAALGVDVAVTEMDARMPKPPTPEQLDQQAGIYAEAMSACLAVSRCTAFTVWGFTDAHSWVPAVHPGSGAAKVFDKDLNPKPAYAALARTLSQPDSPT